MTKETVYSFVRNVPSSEWPAHISLAPEFVVLSCFAREELTSLFGGYARFRDEKTGENWIGVWSLKKASRFRRLLRERGVQFCIQKGEPKELRMISASTLR